MNYLIDTHLLLWAAYQPEKLSIKAKKILLHDENILMFSAASIWEVTIKAQIGRKDFKVNHRGFRRGLLDNGYEEIPINSFHTASIDQLPPIHKDPFDRLLIAQAITEGITLLTSDSTLAPYSDSVVLV